MSRPFKSDLVIQEYICEPTLKAYHGSPEISWG